MWRPKIYPKNWKKLALACKELAGWQCEFCGIKQGRRRKSHRTGKLYRVFLAAAHLDHDPHNPSPRLAALCPSCHGRYDWQWRETRAEVDLERLKHKMCLKSRRRKYALAYAS
jgi:hypothetical protein